MHASPRSSNWLRSAALLGLSACFAACAAAEPAPETLQPGVSLGTLETACDIGEGAACFLAGARHHVGEGTPSDPARARALFEHGCAIGERLSCTSLGRMLLDGQGGARDLVGAAARFLDACDLDESFACNSLGEMYAVGESLARRPAHAAMLFERSCHLGFGPGCYNAGRANVRGDQIEEDPARAAVFFQLGCSLDDGESCLALGVLFENGTGVDASASEALTSYSRACGLGAGDACVRGSALIRSRGELSEAESEHVDELLLVGCSNGSVEGCAQLAETLVGSSEPDDVLRAVALYDYACQRGHAESCLARANTAAWDLSGTERRDYVARACSLASGLACAQHAAYLASLETPDIAGATEAARAACLTGLGRSCALLGELLLLQPDLEGAREAFHRGCVAGDSGSCRHSALRQDSVAD